MKNKRFTKLEALEDILETLKDYNGYIEDLHSEVFNTDYYIIGTYKSKKALEDYGVFDAIDKIKEYENTNLGEVNTDLSNPEAVANMLYYIIGEEVLEEVPSYNLYSGFNDKERKEKIIKEIEEMIKEENDTLKDVHVLGRTGYATI